MEINDKTIEKFADYPHLQIRLKMLRAILDLPDMVTEHQLKDTDSMRKSFEFNAYISNAAKKLNSIKKGEDKAHGKYK